MSGNEPVQVDIEGTFWQGYSPTMPEEEARKRFERKYGRAPERIISTAGALLLGPVTKGMAGSAALFSTEG